MTDITKQKIIEMREQGQSYGQISKTLSVPIGSVRGFCAKHKAAAEASYCLCCGHKLKQTKGHRQKKFCDDRCRYRWRVQNPTQRNLKAFYECSCRNCGKEFIVYGCSKRQFCSWECYQQSKSK